MQNGKKSKGRREKRQKSSLSLDKADRVGYTNAIFEQRRWGGVRTPAEVKRGAVLVRGALRRLRKVAPELRP